MQNFKNYIKTANGWLTAIFICICWLGETPPQTMANQTPPEAVNSLAGTNGADEENSVQNFQEQGEKQPNLTIPQAMQRYVEGEYTTAKEAFERFLLEEESRTIAALGLARCELMTGDYSQAVARLEKFESGGNAEILYELARAKRLLGDYAKCVEFCEQVLALNTDHAAARFLLADTFEYTGRREQALPHFKWFDEQITQKSELPHDARWVTYTGLGFLRYSELTQEDVPYRTQHVLQNMFQVAYEVIDRSYWPARIAAGDLLRAKYNNDEFDGSVSDYRAALRINPNLPEAHVGLGMVALEAWDFEEVDRRIAKALETNPRYLPAFNLRTGNLILQRRYGKARESAAEALKLNPHSIEALSLSAAAAACEYDEAHIAGMKKRAYKINPKPAAFYGALGNAWMGMRQWSRSAEAFKRAIELDPNSADTYIDLGSMYMQRGEEDKAREQLEIAWNLDRFNDRTKFTLELLDQLEDFARYETDHFIVKYNEQMDPGLGEFVARILEGVHPLITSDYNTTLTEKTIVEMFPTQKGFAVRVTGRPWVGTVGACTGRVIAMSSPRESVDLAFGAYDVSRVLIHEFTHTVTLAATDNRIPHWFTEGLAVSQENSPRHFDWARILADAVRLDRLFTLKEIDWGFIRPLRPTDRPQAYAQSEWMVEYIIERFGYEKINEMLGKFADGWTQKRVFEELLGVTENEFDNAFMNWARKDASAWGFDLTEPESPIKLRALALVQKDDASVWGRLAKAEFDEENFGRAWDAAKRALELDESEVNALVVYIKTAAHFMYKDPSGAAVREYQDKMIPKLEKLAKVDSDNPLAPKVLGQIALHRENPDEAEGHLKRLQSIMPKDPASWQGLAGIYLNRDQDDLALVQLLELARLEEHDADVPGRIGQIYRRQGKNREAQYWLNQALMINPFSPKYLEAAGDTNMMLGDTELALLNYKMLAKVAEKKARAYERAALAAKKLGKMSEAKTYARKAVALDPKSSAKALID